MNPLLAASRSRSLTTPTEVTLPSFGSGRDSKLIDDRLRAMRVLLSGAAARIADVPAEELKGLPLGHQLATKVASFKRMTATIAMYLDPVWRTQLFATLDRLLDPDDWDPDFRLPTEPSFSTFLRMIIYLHPTKRPGLGLSPTGQFLAAWTRDTDRIVVECLPGDEVRWVISRMLDGDRETGAGKVLLHRVPEVTAPYKPEVLFANGEKLLA